MFLGYRVFRDPEEIKPLSISSIIGFYLIGMGFIGLLLAFKWEIAGALISLVFFCFDSRFS